MKVGGNAQRWLKSAMLHHGTLLSDFDLASIPRYLSRPERQPEYRAGRDHAAFVTNLDLPRATVTNAVRAAFGAGGELDDPPLELMRDLMGGAVRGRGVACEAVARGHTRPRVYGPYGCFG